MLIAQISDLHVKPEGRLYADLVPSNAMAAAAVAQLNGLAPRPDLVLVTGDLVDAGTDEEYAVARRILERIEIPYLVIPGNHDVVDGFRRAFADHAYLPATGALHYCVDAHPVRIVALDSTVAGKHHGDIDVSGLAWSRKRKVYTEVQFVTSKRERKFFDPEMESIQKDLEKQLPGYEVDLQSSNKDENIFVVAAWNDRTISRNSTTWPCSVPVLA